MWLPLELYLICCLLAWHTDLNFATKTYKVIRNDKWPPVGDNCKGRAVKPPKVCNPSLTKSIATPQDCGDIKNNLGPPKPNETAIKKIIPGDIIRMIKQRKFTYAEELLRNIADIEQFAKDVRAKGSFELVIELAEALTTITPSFLLLKSLFDEELQKERKDYLQMISIANALQQEVLEQYNIQPDLKKKSQLLLNNVIELLKQTSTDYLSRSMVHKVYPQNRKRLRLCNDLFNFKPDINYDVMRRIINNVFPVMSPGDILRNIQSHEHVPQRLGGIIVLFEKMKKADRLNDDTVYFIAAELSWLNKIGKLDRLTEDKQEQVVKIIDALPNCVKNIFFENIVCLWNKGWEEYIFAANATYNYNNEWRGVYSWDTGGLTIGSYWNAITKDRNVYFRNFDRPDEYMYASNIGYNHDLGYVLTWIAGGKVGTNAAWRVEFNGNYCYLKSVYFQKYLFLSPLMRSNEIRYTFVWKREITFNPIEYFQWEIRKC